MRVAVVHDWLVTYAGSERVVEQILHLFPDADLFSLMDFLAPVDRVRLGGRHAHTSFLQRLPGARRHYPLLLPLMPLAIEQFDLTPYDLVISSSHCVAKGVLTGPDQLHVSYVHTPMRYAWDAQHEYLADRGLSRGLRGLVARRMLHKLRLWDARSAAGVDSLVANSHFIARRIAKAYRRTARVIYPPVDVRPVAPQAREDYYVTASRLVGYKRLDVLVEAFARLPERRLVVIGNGPELKPLRRCATPNVEFLLMQPPSVVRDHLARARAFVYAAREDFGIVLVEAQAQGTPIIAFGQGGAAEIVRPLGCARPTGLLYDEQTPASLLAAIDRFEREHRAIREADCRENAARFSAVRFQSEFHDHVMRQWELWKGGQQTGRADGDSDLFHVRTPGRAA